MSDIDFSRVKKIEELKNNRFSYFQIKAKM